MVKSTPFCFYKVCEVFVLGKRKKKLVAVWISFQEQLTWSPLFLGMFHSLIVGFALLTPQGKLRFMVIGSPALPSSARINLWKFHFFVSALFLLPALRVSDASGYFELQIDKLQNSRGELANGSCCRGTSNESNVCTLTCRTYFRVCLKEYQSIATTGRCTFGNISSEVLEGNSFMFTSTHTHSPLILQFNFSWTVSNKSVNCIFIFISYICVCVW